LLKDIIFFLIILFFLFSCKQNPSSSDNIPEPTKQYVIDDYKYVAFKYFFIDSFYKNNFDKGFNKNLDTYYYPFEYDIQNLDVFINTNYGDIYAIRGLASTTPSKYDNLTKSEYDTLQEISGKLEKSFFKPLTKGKDYFFDCYSQYYGFFYFNKPIENSRIIAISYRNNFEKVGTLLSEYVDDPQNVVLNLKLIKNKNMTPINKDSWYLMLKNVYEIDNNILNYHFLDINIEYDKNGEFVNIQPNNPNKHFTNLLGLDIKDNSTGEIIENGDDKLDFNVLSNWFSKGVLIFPLLQPFDPLIDSRFQLNTLNRAKIYTINPSDSLELIKNSKFKIIIKKYD